MNRAEVAKKIDHTNLKPEATEEDIRKLCREAQEYGFCAVCVNPCKVQIAASLLKGTDIKVCSVIGFPLGAHTTKLKVAEAEQAVTDGATEIDMVMNIGWLKEGNHRLVEEDIRAVRAALAQEIILKVIIEAALLSDDEKRDAAKLVIQAGGDFVKTSTGFNPAGGASLSDVSLLKAVVGSNAKIKAAGGIRDAKTAIQFIEAGTDRIGASSSATIINEIPN